MRGVNCKRFLWAGILAVFLLLTQAPFAEEGSQGQEIKEKEDIEESLSLTEEQRTQIHQEQLKQVAERKRLAIEENRIRKALRAELEKEKSGEAAIEALISEINAIRAEVIELQVQSVKRLKAILNEEQFAQVVTMQKQARDEREEKKSEIDKKWHKWKEESEQEKRSWYYYW